MVIFAVVCKEVASLDMGGVRKFEETPNGYRGMHLDPARNLRKCL